MFNCLREEAQSNYRVVVANVQVKCLCPHFAISTKLADLPHTRKMVDKMLRKSKYLSEAETFSKEIKDAAGRERGRLQISC